MSWVRPHGLQTLVFGFVPIRAVPMLWVAGKTSIMSCTALAPSDSYMARALVSA